MPLVRIIPRNARRVHNPEDINGAITAVVEATGWSIEEASQYLLGNLDWWKEIVAIVSALAAAWDITGGNQAQARHWLGTTVPVDA